MFYPDGGYCDVTTLPDGRVALVRSTAVALIAQVLGEPEPRFTVDIRALTPPWHFTRAAANAIDGRICAVAQTHAGEAVIVVEGQAPFIDGSITGASACEVEGFTAGAWPGADRGGWIVYLARGGSVEQLLIGLEGAVVARASFPVDDSQGFLSADFGELMADDGRRYAPTGRTLLVLPESVDGAIWFGQHPDDPPRYRAARANGDTATVLQVGGQGEPPHVARAGDGTLVVCGYTPGGSWVEAFDPERLPWGNDTAAPPVTPEPPPPHPPDPPQETPVPKMTAAIAADITEFYRRFPPPVKDEGAQQTLQGQLCETIRARHGSRYGWKRADPGRPPSKDALAMQDNGRLYIWDCLEDAGGDNPRLSAAVADGAEALDVTGQVFIPVDAIDHLATGQQPGGGDPPPTDPPPAPAPDPRVVVALEHLVATGDAQLAELQRINGALTASAATEARILASLERLGSTPAPGTPPAPGGLDLDTIVAAVLAELRRRFGGL